MDADRALMPFSARDPTPIASYLHRPVEKIGSGSVHCSSSSSLRHQYGMRATRSRSRYLLIEDKLKEEPLALRDGCIPALPHPSSLATRTIHARSYLFKENSESFCAHHVCAQEGNVASLQKDLPSLSCVDSSECHDVGAETATENKLSVPHHQGFEEPREIDAMSEVGSLETCNKDDGLLPLRIDCSAFDLLVSAAMQVFSDGLYGDKDDVAPGPSKRIESEARFVHGRSERVPFNYGAPAIVKKKRVIRRAKNAFKKPNVPNVLQKSGESEAAGFSYGTRRRTRASYEKDQRLERQDVSDLKVSEVSVRDEDTMMDFVRKRLRTAPLKAKICASPLTASVMRQSETSEVIPAVHYVRRKKGKLAIDEDEVLLKDSGLNMQGSELTQSAPTMEGLHAAQINDGDPIIRSVRGRSQILPTKFYDSVLQPWKARPRGNCKAK